MIKSIICGDSTKVLAKFPDSFVDLVITSPPYNAGHDYDIYDDNIELDNYYNMLSSCFKEIFRVLKDDGKVCINVPFAIKNMKTKKVHFLATQIANIVNDIGFKDFEMITWHKGKNINHFQGNNTAWGSWKSPSCPNCRPMCEAVMVFYKNEKSHKGLRKNIDITSEEFKEYTKNSWYIVEDDVLYEDIICESNTAKKNIHPAPYPLELIERLVKLYSYKDDVILDPFNGIGTTTHAACNLSRQFIGIDLSEKYCDIAIERIKTHNPNLFIYNDDFKGLVNSDLNEKTLNYFFPYKESFNPNILKYLEDTKKKSILDPFSGTGSSFMSNLTNDAICYAFDTNPLSIEIIKAKLIKIDTTFYKKITSLVELFNTSNIKKYKFPEWEPYCKYASQEKYDIVQSFINYFSQLDEISYRFVKYLVISNLQEIFDYKRDGNGIKFRESKLSIDNTIDYLKKLVINALSEKKKFDKNNKRTINICFGSSIIEDFNFNVDIVITSPPYCNMFDYLEVYKMELWTSGLISNSDEWKTYKKNAMRSNQNANINDDDVYSPILKNRITRLEEKSTDIRTIKMIKNYFYDMNALLAKVSKIINEKSKFYIVVGNSFYSGVSIPSDEIIAELAHKHDFKVNKLIIARKLSTSSQQLSILKNSEKLYLRETIIELERI